MTGLRVFIVCLLIALTPLRAYAALDCCPASAAPSDVHAGHAGHAGHAPDTAPADETPDGCAGLGCVQHCAGLTALLPVLTAPVTPAATTLAPDVDTTRPASLDAHAPERPPRPAA